LPAPLFIPFGVVHPAFVGWTYKGSEIEFVVQLHVMKHKLGGRLFFAGALMLVLMAAVHSLSLFQKPEIRNESEKQLMDLMNNYKFTVMGSARTMNDFLRGFSISFGLASLGFGILDFTLCRERASLLKRIALVNAIWLAVMTAVSVRYFFALPTSFLAATTAVFVLAWVKLPAVDAN
jgi:hypothetical protein